MAEHDDTNGVWEREFVALEVTAIRLDREYECVTEEPASGNWWAVQLVPVCFPGMIAAPSSQPYCVVAAERTSSGWRWCYLTPVAKHFFLHLLRTNAKPPHVWHYVVEHDVPATSDAGVTP